jgi:hypothetical protein
LRFSRPSDRLRVARRGGDRCALGHSAPRLFLAFRLAAERRHGYAGMDDKGEISVERHSTQLASAAAEENRPHSADSLAGAVEDATGHSCAPDLAAAHIGDFAMSTDVDFSRICTGVDGRVSSLRKRHQGSMFADGAAAEILTDVLTGSFRRWENRPPVCPAPPCQCDGRTGHCSNVMCGWPIGTTWHLSPKGKICRARAKDKRDDGRLRANRP